MRIAIIPAIAACSIAALIVTESPARADASQDQEFYRLLTEPDQTHPMQIWNFPAVRSQGIEACRLEDAGESPYEATKSLEQPNGPYTWDAANNVASSAEVVYCPWHAAPQGGGSSWVDTSNPVYPPPAYPPLAWYPPPPAYSGGGE